MKAVTSGLEDTLYREIDRSGLTGLAIALVQGNETVWESAYGRADVEGSEAITTDTPLAIMSVTKTIVSTAAMQLRDEGHFRLSDPVNKLLAPAQIQNQWEAVSPVRVGQLMTHTSGLPVGIAGPPAGKMPLEQFVSAVARCERPPGEAIMYANWGFDALGVLISRCSGLAVDTYLRERIFEPLGMRTAVLGDPPEDLRATGHYRSFVDGKIRPLPLPEWPAEPASPAGGCWMTVGDLARFLAAHLSGGAPLLSPATTAEMHRLQVRQGASDSGMGLGFRVTRSNGRRMICHGGDGGGFTAFIGAYREERVGVALVINTAGMQRARSVIGNTALELLAGAPQRRTFAAASIPDGEYKSTFWDIHLEARSGEPPTLAATEGLVLADEASVSELAEARGGRWEGAGGMFHGFEVSVEGETITGGVYPFVFERVGPIRDPELIDEDCEMAGAWHGTIETPLGEMATTLEVSSASDALLRSPLVPSAVLENCLANSGRVEAEFSMSIPGIGEFRNFVRLRAIGGGRLAGKVYARGSMGEVGMRAEFERA